MSRKWTSGVSPDQKIAWARSFFNRYYPGFKEAEARYEELIESSLNEKMVVLDAGCGQAATTSKYAHRVKTVVGTDLDIESLKASSLDNLAMADLKALPFQDGSFDLIVCRWVLEHLPKPQVAFREFHRVARSDAQLIILTSNAFNYVMILSRILPLGLKQRILARLGRGKPDTFPTYYRCNSPSRLLETAASAGFKAVRLELVGNPFYLFFSKPLFVLAVAYEKITDLTFLKKGKIHMVASFRKE